MNGKKPKLLCIVGPTASGKTALSLELARRFEGEVIAADSRTIFRGMNIGTAKPEGQREHGNRVTADDVERHGIHVAKQRAIGELFTEKPLLVEGVSHWGLDMVNPDEAFTAADFKQYAEEKIERIVARDHIPMLVGGTGLYVQAVVDNMQFTDAEPDQMIRQEIADMTNQALIDFLEEHDVKTAETIDQANRRRLLRAVEVIKSTGKPYSEQQLKGEPHYDVLMLGMDIDREELYERIDARVDEMIANGLVDEVRILKEQYGCEINAMTGIGYRQICAFLDGYMKLRDAIDVLKRDTRHYAKRQLTWFKRDSRVHWVKGVDEALPLVEGFLNRG